MDVLMGLLDIKRGDVYDLGCEKNSNGNAHYWLYILWNRIHVVDLPIPQVVAGRLPSPVLFRKDIRDLPPIFKSCHENGQWVTEVFKSAVENAGLSGFEFTLLGEIK